MNWKYSSRYWKYATDIFVKGQDFLRYRSGYTPNFRLYYSFSKKELLHRRIFRDYINMILEEVSDGNVVVLNKGVNFYLKEKDVYINPYDDIYERLTANGKMLYIYLNTGEYIKDNKLFLVIPSKKIRSKLLKLKGSGKAYTQVVKDYFK